ncbi:hypothetical protein GH714_019902 [Hevea brasiliensis]|uniref:Malectin-like domain-containing protein n=1 Tax=Hevea brasiliensis TaxID=3981 RepID=A0A6A6LJ94_HEVBR|nr:hypothetical protein GH714_019902 [Hevea brasiliensis]
MGTLKHYRFKIRWRFQDKFSVESCGISNGCASTTSATRPTMNQVVVELNECLTTEMAPTGGFNSSFEIVAVDDDLLSEVSGDFISIDCGITDGSSYVDEITSINYVSDAPYIYTGVSENISSEINTMNMDRQYLNLRSFPEGTKSCYTLNATQGKNNRYLIRAGFLYGNYDKKGDVPRFDLYLGVNWWQTVVLNNASSFFVTEIIHVSASNHIDVCLVNTGFGTPFISVLELRPLKNDIYVNVSGSLENYERCACGLTSDQAIRDLSSSGLTGPISSSISKLTMLQFLDLSNNDLTGPVPDFLSQLQFLRVLNLANNKLSGEMNEHNGTSKLKEQNFSYSEILNITDKLERVLGNGKFGTIFHGYLDDTQVAVKISFLHMFMDISNSKLSYYITNKLIERHDVYSFGLVLLAIITSQPVIAKNPEKTHIIKRVKSLLGKGDINNIVDSKLKGNFQVDSVWKTVELAMACVSSPPINRPTMTRVVTELNQCLAMEIARLNRSEGTIELVTVNLTSGLDPQAR